MTAKRPATLARDFSHQPTIVVQFPLLGILEQAREFGWRVVGVDLLMENFHLVRNIVGAIVGYPLDHPASSWARDLHCPMVRNGRLANPFDDRLPAVIGDYAAAGRLAAEHLAERNFRYVAMVGSKDMLVTDVMGDAFRCRAGQLGCDCRILVLPKHEECNSSAQKRELHMLEMRRYFQEVPKPIGLFCVSYVIGGRAIVMAQQEGLAVPEDVAVLSCGNDPIICNVTSVPMSAVEMDGNLQGREAVCLLRRLINGGKAPRTPIVVPPVGVVERHSTNVFIVPDPAVSLALRLIWDHLDQEISVNDIARQVGVSRRSLERSFHRCTGRSMTAERQRKRLERCAELLRTTNWPIESIAASVGFTSASYLYRSFRKKFGRTPAAFRERSGS
jgi:LacI family transcriptional regulator